MRRPSTLARALVLLPASALALIAAPIRAQNTAPAEATPRVDLDKLKRPAPAAEPSNLFNSRSWEKKAPPKKAAPPPPPPPPQAPPLPFTYMGRWIERGETTVMLGQGPRNFTVREGEKVDASYLLEKIGPDRLVFRYVPLDQTQVLLLASNPGAATALPVPAMPPGLTVPRVPLSPTQQKRGPARDADDEED